MLLICLPLQFNIQKSSGEEKVKCDVKILESYCTQVLLWNQYLLNRHFNNFFDTCILRSKSTVILGTKLEVSASISTEVSFFAANFLQFPQPSWTKFILISESWNLVVFKMISHFCIFSPFYEIIDKIQKKCRIDEK